MVDVNVEFTLGNENPINAEFTLEPDVTYLANIVTATFSGEHNQLIHREYPDQHPIEAITGLTEGLNNLSSAIDDETARAENAENILNGKIDDEISRAILAEGTLQDNIDAEETRAKRVEERLSGLVDSNYQAISNHVADKNNPHEVTKTQVGLGNVENLSPADMPISTATQTALNTKVDDVRVGGTSVVTNRIANLGTMAGQSAESYSTTAEADALYATAAQGELADTAIQPNDNISLLTNNSNYQTGTQVANSIATETTARENADNNLQGQIDAITSSSDVTDIVGTYAQLQAYDTSTLPPNSIIKVLQDESRNNETTYYRWVVTGGVGSWVLIGEEGPYYTKSEANSTFVPQTRTVNNKALSSDITLTATDVGALPSSTVIPTVNNATITIQKNGSTVNTFTLNQSSNETVNISVPTKTSDITNDSGFITNADLPTNYVTTDTAQTITGLKTFTENSFIKNTYPFIEISNINLTKGTNPTTTQYAGLLFEDKDANGQTSTRLGDLVLSVDSSGNVTNAFKAWNYNGSGSAAIRVIYPTNGTPYATAPAPTEDTNNSTQIDTVGARNTKLQNYALSSSLANVATSGSYNDLSDKPTIPTVNNATLTIQKNGTTVKTFTANASTNVTANITVPTKTSDLTNDSNFATVSQIPTNNNQLTNGAGYITGINSSDVTTALGYTPADDSNVVKTTGNQTVGGEKTFTGNTLIHKSNEAILFVDNTSADTQTAPSSMTYIGSIKFRGTDNKEVFNIRGALLTTGTQLLYNLRDYSDSTKHLQSSLQSTIDHSTGRGYLVYNINSNGSGDERTPVNYSLSKETNSSVDVTIPTMGWVNNPATSTNVVHRTGDETIGGNKTYSNGISVLGTTNAPFVHKRSSLTKGTAPSSNIQSRWRMTDSAGTGNANSIGGVDITYGTNGTINSKLIVFKPEEGSTQNGAIGIYYPATGDPYTEAPTPPTSDSSTKIATTAYVKAQGYAATRYVDGMVGTARYATSTTAAATVEKVVSIPEITSLEVGQCIIVQPTITSTVADSTIKLNNFTAYPMRYNNAAITTSTDSVVWNQNYPTVWMFDGTYWVFITHGIDSNTTYSAMSVAEGTAGTATNNRVMRADYLKQILDNRIQLVNSLPATPESNILYCIPES